MQNQKIKIYKIHTHTHTHTHKTQPMFNITKSHTEERSIHSAKDANEF